MSKSKRENNATATTSRPETVVRARYVSAIGIDVHHHLLVCAYQTCNSPNQITTESAEFGTSRSDLDRFAQWCKHRDPEVVVMESTGVLWQSPYCALEDAGFTEEQLVLVNARDVKAVIGRKTDQQDAVRLAEIARLGTLKKSFIPPRPFRLQRTIERDYQKLRASAATQTNRIHKMFNQCGCRASTVFSDIRGVAATAIIEGWLIGGEAFFAAVKQYGRRLKATDEQIIDAMDFPMSETLREQLQDQRALLKQMQKTAQASLDRLRQLQAPHKDKVKLLMTIPGINEVAARLIFAELCDDLGHYFKDSEHFCSWIGICPGNNISANKSYSGRTAKGNRWLRQVLTECAQGIALSKSELKDRFLAFKLRRGSLRAIVAIAHLLARIIYSVLISGKPFKYQPSSKTSRDVLRGRVEKNVSAMLDQDKLVPCGDMIVVDDANRVLLKLRSC